MQFLFRLLGLIPQNLVSFLVGWLSRLTIPKSLRLLAGGAFVKLFGIDLSEAAVELPEYCSFEEIFTRKLKDGVRPVNSKVISPCDGYLARSEPMLVNNEGRQQLIQAKGINYDPATLVSGSLKLPDYFTPAWYTTIYLAPHNYHRVHMPMTANLNKMVYIPGRLWPVNKPAVRWVKNLFNINERLVFEFANDSGRFFLVMVGALNVGRMTSPFWPNFASNDFGKNGVTRPVVKEFMKSPTINIAQELGTFMLGSTVVMVFDQNLTEIHPLKQTVADTPIKMGESILR